MNLKDFYWNKSDYEKFVNYLIKISDHKSQTFNQKIITTRYEILGIKIPILKKISREISKGNYNNFIKIIDTRYYELVMLKGLVIANIKTLEELELFFNNYLNLIDNWALCDTFCSSLKIVNKNKAYFLKIISNLIVSNLEYKVRVGLVLLLDYYMEKEYLKDIYKFINASASDKYYINMARAWLLCECFIKYQDETLTYLENNNLDKFTINKAISKIRDSYRVSKEIKDYILKFKK